MDDVISTYIDKDGIKRDTEFMLENINKVYDAIKRVGSLEMTLKGVTSGKELEKITRELAAANKVLESSTRQLTNISKAQADAELKLAKAQKETAKASLDNARAKKLENQERERAEKIAVREKQLMDQIGNDYKQLSIALKDAEERYKSLYLVKGKDNEATQAALKEALGIRKVLNDIDQSLGNYQRNVGNYASATDNLKMSLQQLLRETPSLAVNLNTFLLAISNNLPIFFDSIQKAKAANVDLAANGKATVPVFGQIVKGLFSWQSALTVVVTVLTLFGGKMFDFVSSLFKAKEAVDPLERKLDDLTRSAEGTKKAIQDVNQELDFLAEKRRLEIELKFFDDPGKASLLNTIEDLETLKKKGEELNKIAENAKQRRQGGFLTVLDAFSGEDRAFMIDNNINDFLDLSESQLKKFSEEGQKAIKVYQGLKDAENEASKEIQRNNQSIEQQQLRISLSKKQYAKEQQDQAKDEAKKNRELTERDAKAVFELKKLYLEKEIDLQKAFAGSDAGGTGGSLDVVLQARKLQFEKTKELIELERDFELRDSKLRADEIVLIRTKAAEKIAVLEAELSSDLLAIRFNAEKALIDGARASIEAYEAEQARKIDERFSELTKGFEREQKLFEKGGNERLTLLNNEYAAGNISKEKYEKDKAQIETIYLKKSLQGQIQYYKALIDLYEFDEGKKGEALLKLSELEKKFSEISLADKKKSQEDQLAFYEQLKEKLLSFGLELENTVFSLLDASVTRRKNAIREEMDLLEERKAKEIELVNNSTLSEEKKAAQIAVINARAQAQKEALERRQRQLDQQKAKFDRAKSVAGIIQNTAQAVTAVLPNFILAAVVGAIGAAQLFQVLAQPIPKYREGTKDHPGGLAWVGDGGKSELIVTPEGRMIETPSTDTLVDLPRHSMVFPDAKKALAVAANGALVSVVSTPFQGGLKSAGNGLNEASFMKGIKSLKETIKNKQENHFKFEGPVKQHIKQGESWREYLNRNI